VVDCSTSLFDLAGRNLAVANGVDEQPVVVAINLGAG
jgi:hypothetical protein